MAASVKSKRVLLPKTFDRFSSSEFASLAGLLPAPLDAPKNNSLLILLLS